MQALEAGLQSPESSEEAEKLAQLFERLKESNSATAQSLGNDVLLNLLLRNLTRRLETLEQSLSHLREALAHIEGGLRSHDELRKQLHKDLDKRVGVLEAIRNPAEAVKPKAVIEKLFPAGLNQTNTTLLFVLLAMIAIGVLEMLGVDVVETMLPFIGGVTDSTPPEAIVESPLTEAP